MLNHDVVIFLFVSEAIGNIELGLFSLYQTECFKYSIVLPFAIFFYDRIPFKASDTFRKAVFVVLGKNA